MKNLRPDSVNRGNPEEIKRIESERMERVKNELLQKKVEVGQVRELTVDKSTRLDDLNGAEIRITYVNQESGWVGFELTENNSPDMSEAIKGRPLMAEVRSLFNPGKNVVQEKTTSQVEKIPETSEKLEEEREQFRKAVEQKKIEIGEYYIIKGGVFNGFTSQIIGIDYINCKVRAGVTIFGKQQIPEFEIDELGEELSVYQERERQKEDKQIEEILAKFKERKIDGGK